METYYKDTKKVIIPLQSFVSNLGKGPPRPPNWFILCVAMSLSYYVGYRTRKR